MKLDDFEYMGKSEISVVSRKYLGVFKKIDSVNNEAYNFRDVKVVNLSGLSNIKLKTEMRKAAYKVLDDYPDASFYVVGSDYTKVHKLFLGSRHLRSMEIHAYKYKNQ
ncbi:hypothetical protein BFP72_15075 [Reichenbachiella sp. 5M10]|nr:hypothetical protein BFP72_15075 [Reichenbachiella sp. 5M10]